MTKQILGALLLALAAGGAAAQSSVTLYGKVDIGARKSVGSANKEIATSGDSRLGFKGVEDLGGGNSAFFGFEHRFFAENGTVDGSQFWKGYANVGLAGRFGRLGIGRQYIAAFSLIQNQIDPFEADTVAQLRDVAMRVGGITKVRVDASLRYDFSAAGFGFAASMAEADKNGGPDRPFSLGANYRQGALFLGAGYENPAGARDKQVNFGGGYTFGPATVTAGAANGTTDAGVKAKGWMLGLNWVAGSGAIKAAYGVQQRGGVDFAKKLGLGYHHSLSKRTLIYTDVGHDRQLKADKTGWDLGIRHQF